MIKSKYLTFTILALVIIGLVFINGCLEQSTTAPSEKSKLEQPKEQISPSIKIEHATATLKEVVSNGQVICTVEMSGTVSGPICSDLWIAWGTSGEPGIKLYPITCPDWRYVGTSGICSRDLNNEQATTRWSIKTDNYIFLKGKGTEFFAVLDTPKLPLAEMAVGNPCAIAELGNRIWDSVTLTCG